jgi:acyl-CoA-dependent ceramide synthase
VSYYKPEIGLYAQGGEDSYFVASSILAFTAVRALCIDWIFRPMAKRFGLKKKASMRFAEQAWLLVYDLSYWSFGMVSEQEIYRPCWSPS